MITRRRFLVATGAGMVAAAYGPVRALAQGGSQTITLTGTATHLGQYLYFPFEVPANVNRIDVKITKQGTATTGVGLFDERGSGYQSAGFRGIYGEERSEFFVAADRASQSFIPGPILPGTWTVVVPVFVSAGPSAVSPPTTVTATVTLTFGEQPAAFVPGIAPDVVLDQPGWYRGDLHCHTPESSDAWKSGSAMAPAQWADAMRRVGLDYAAMTDHNVISQNFNLGLAAGSDVLLIAGEEMTNWFHGHATVTGIDVGDWLDWRQTPAGLPLPSGEPGARIQNFLATAREMGAFVSAAHPLGAHLSWQFLADGELDPAARPDAFEVWTGAFQPDDEGALKMWDSRVREGWKVWANGGTDLHGVNNSEGFAVGTPTTIVYADRLSKTDIVAALRKGRSFVTRKPDGVELYLTGVASQGQHQIVGGTLYGAPTDVAEIEVLVRRAAGMRLLILRDGVPISVTPISTDPQTVTAAAPIGPAGGAVRAEVRSVPEIDPAKPRAGRTDMEAFTNPILLVNGPVPADAAPVFAPPGPPGPRRTAATAANADVTRSIGGAALPATGSGAAVALATAGAAGAVNALRRRVGPGDAVPMTITEFGVRATGDGGLSAVRVRVAGQITEARADGTRVLTRWVPACCATHEAPVSLDARALDVPVGTWVEADGTWVEGTGQRGTTPALEVARWRVLDEPPPRREA